MATEERRRGGTRVRRGLGVLWEPLYRTRKPRGSQSMGDGPVAGGAP
jgi:hypothetical protein